MLIRNEQAADTAAIFRLTKTAFVHHPFGDHTEQFVNDALRAAGALAVSLVAEAGTEIIGHVAFSRVTISDGSPDWYGLGPVSVLPEQQNRGIGTALITEGLARIKALGAQGCVVLGAPAYYQRFGFVHTPELVYEGAPPIYFLAQTFGECPAHGVVQFHPAFDARE